MIRALLLDMDGVLVDSQDAWYRLINDVARTLACAPVSAAAFRRSWGQSVAEDAREFFPGHAPERVQQLYVERFEHHLEGVAVDAHAVDLFTSTRSRGLVTAVVTNTPRAMATAILSHGELEPDALICGSDVARAKPAPDMLIEACRRLQVRANEAIMVGDSCFDREAAATAGIYFAGLGIPGDATLTELTQVLPLVAALGASPPQL